jgi:hypothetical protein
VTRPRALTLFSLRQWAILALLVTLLLSAVLARDTWSSKGQSAQAGSCAAQLVNWKMYSGAVGPSVARAQFGATVCTEAGRITSVSPVLSGGVEGAGTPLGFVWENRGAVVITQTASYVEVQGRATLKECLAKVIALCSLTDTQTFTLKFHSQAGPYQPGTEPGSWAASKSCTVGGGCYSATRFVQV